MLLNTPEDIRAEIVANYLEDTDKDISFLGNHKRNAYEDILSISRDEGRLKIELARKGLYDILPEALFHTVNRFDDIPPNEYKERFAEEIEKQQIEESNARSFFSLYDRFIFDLSSTVAGIKDREYSGNRVLSDIICDSLPHKYASNRFVARAKEFIPRCSSIRGNVALITLMLRKVMSDEGLKLIGRSRIMSFEDNEPRYACRLSRSRDSEDLFLGNCYDENILCYDVQYWDEDYCNESFLSFVEEINVFEEFVNDFFMGIETSVRFNLSTHGHPVRLSDEQRYNYLNYNTNI